MVIEQNMRKDYPQDKEANEFRYLSPAWINAVATGLTAGAEKHPGETWRSIPAEEHAWRAVRHLILWLAGDREDKHLDNASMRVMMAWETSKNENVAGVRVELASDIDVGRKGEAQDDD